MPFNSTDSLDRSETLHREAYLPFYLSQLANAVSRGASRVYLRLFGIGVVEWRILSVLAIQPDIFANDICQAVGIDKAAASRCLKQLEAGGHVDTPAKFAEKRIRPYRLTRKGHELHGSVLKVALQREAILTANLTPGERATLIGLLQKLTLSLPALDRFDDGIVDGKPTPKA
jgi:DNA-binding MarR family transcriptional regulator